MDRAYEAARTHNLTGQQTRLLVFMAHRAHDGDAQPRYWAGWRVSAAALGLTIPAEPVLPTPDTTRVHSSVTKALRALAETTPPLIRRVSDGHRGRTAVYELHLPLVLRSPSDSERYRETDHLSSTGRSDRQRETDNHSERRSTAKGSAFEHERQRVLARKVVRNALPEHQEHQKTPPVASKHASTVEGDSLHEHHGNALAALTRICTERRLPLTTDELMTWAYQLGHGDPWAGYGAIREETNADFTTGAHDPRAVLLGRLRKVAAAPPPRREQPQLEGYSARAHKLLPDGTCNHCEHRPGAEREACA